MSHIDFKIFTGIVLKLLDLFIREQINFSVEKQLIGLKKKELGGLHESCNQDD